MQQTLRLACAATFLTSALCHPVFAQSDETNQVLALNTITVTATRNPQNSFDIPGMVSVVESDDPSVAGAASLKNLLQNVNGLEFEGSARRNGQNIVLRGYGTDGIVVLFDGVRQKFESAHDGKFFIDPSLLKTVEVVKGPSSALYGNGGLGGVVSLTTKDASDLLKEGQTAGAMVSGGYQSVNQEWMSAISGYAKTDNVDVVVSTLTRNSDDVKLGDGSKLLSQDNVLSGLVKIGWSPDADQKITFGAQSYHNDAKEPNNPQSSDSSDLVNKDSQSHLARIQYEYNPENNLVDFNGQIYGNRIDVQETILAATGTNDIGDKISRTLDSTGIILENKSRFNEDSSFANTFTYGLNAYNEKQNGQDSANGEVGGIPDAKSDFWGIYLQDEITLKPEFIPGEFLIIPGIRFDNYQSQNAQGQKVDASESSPKFATTYKPSDWLMVFGSYAHAFRAPSMTEIYTTGTHFTIPGMGSNVFVPNTALKPETSDTVEFGFGMKFADLLQKDDLLQFKFSRFETKSRDFIDTAVDFVFFPTCCGTTTSVNVDRAKLWGHEFEGGYENDRLTFNLGYSYITGKNETDGSYLTNIMPLTFKTNVGIKLPDLHCVIGVRSAYAMSHKKVNDDSAKRQGYGVHNLYYQFHPAKRDDITLNLGIDNVFDKAYTRVYGGSYEPGRNYRVRVSYKW